MVNTIAFLLIVFGIMFLIGIAMAILALYSVSYTHLTLPTNSLV